MDYKGNYHKIEILLNMVEVFPVHVVTTSLNKLEYLPRVTLELVSLPVVRAGGCHALLPNIA